jgi:hypothetical protein
MIQYSHDLVTSTVSNGTQHILVFKHDLKFENERIDSPNGLVHPSKLC